MVLREIHGPRNARMRMQDCPENDREQKAAINLDCYGSFRTPVPKPTHCELPPQRTGGIPRESHPGETLGEAFLSLQMAADGEVALYRRGTEVGNRYFFRRLPWTDIVPVVISTPSDTNIIM
jgi:hypothetical protein